MYGFTYDLWKELISDVIDAHDPLFMAMIHAADGLSLSKALIDELKQKGVKEIGDYPWHFLLEINHIADHIEGFSISLLASEDRKVFEQIVADAATDREISWDDIEGFELEHGLDLNEDIFEEIEDIYDIRAQTAKNVVFFELVIFDSQDIDNSRERDEAWADEELAGHLAENHYDLSIKK
jgi:hypothetical protein